MLKKTPQQNNIEKNNGQNTIEYILVFVLVVLVLLGALGPNGFLTQEINQTLDLSVNAIDNMVVGVWP